MDTLSPLVRQFQGKASALMPLMEDARVTDILINGCHSLYVDREGTLVPETNPFPDASALGDFIERLLLPVGKRVDAAHPYADGRCLDGSRFHIVLPPIAVNGPLISLRKFRDRTEGGLLESFGPPELIQWLTAQVAARKNILIAGGTGTGKTTLLCCLLEAVPPGERIVVVEETLEIRSHHPHLIRLEARPPSPEGLGEVTLRQLVRHTLRMRPDRIVLGECRGGEALDLLQVMNTGHPGSFCTLHANGAPEALRRLEALVLLSGLALPLRNLREWVGNTIDVAVYLERGPEGRRIQEVLLVQGVEGEVYRITPWYRAEGPDRPNKEFWR